MSVFWWKKIHYVYYNAYGHVLVYLCYYRVDFQSDLYNIQTYLFDFLVYTRQGRILKF